MYAVSAENFFTNASRKIPHTLTGIVNTMMLSISCTAVLTNIKMAIESWTDRNQIKSSTMCPSHMIVT